MPDLPAHPGADDPQRRLLLAAKALVLTAAVAATAIALALAAGFTLITRRDA